MPRPGFAWPEPARLTLEGGGGVIASGAVRPAVGRRSSYAPEMRGSGTMAIVETPVQEETSDGDSRPMGARRPEAFMNAKEDRTRRLEDKFKEREPTLSLVSPYIVAGPANTKHIKRPPCLPVANRLESFWPSERDAELQDARTRPDLPLHTDVVIVGSGLSDHDELSPAQGCRCGGNEDQSCHA